ncbi:MAG: SDR family oxidoreductase [Sedimenticola sp.]
MNNNYFITGVTGTIGSALIPLLLETKESRIFALMRAESEERLAQRLEKLIGYWGLDGEQADDARRRVIPVMGDMSEPRFGISEKEYDRIAGYCTHIIHCAGVVRMNLPLEEARQHAVGSAENIVELALQCKVAGNLKKVEFVSTVGVGGRMTGIIPERWITEHRQFHNTYEASKAEAEDYLREQIELHQLPVTVHRPSMVVGDSETGKVMHFQIFYHLCEFLSGRRTGGIFPTMGSTRLDTVPSDYVARAICWSANTEMAIGKIFHLCSGPSGAIALQELRGTVREIFREGGVRLPPVVSLPVPLFSLLIKSIKPFLNQSLKRAVGTLPVFLDYLNSSQLFENKETLSFMETYQGPELPLSRDYLHCVLMHYLKQQHGR